MFHVVIRPFEGKRPFVAGEIVETSEWRLLHSLVERRFVRPATPEEIEAEFGPHQPVEAASIPVASGPPAPPTRAAKGAAS